MGLREKVTLVFIAVVFYKTVCSICVLQTKENPFDKYINKRKYDKSIFLSKYTTGNNQKTLPKVDYLPDTISKVPNYLPNTETSKTSTIDVLNDSTLLNNLRKEKRRKRKNKQTEKRQSREHDHQEHSSYFTAMEIFPEVQYPLTASDIWAPSYWNPPYNEEDAYFKKDDFNNQNQNIINKPVETFLQPLKLKENKVMLTTKDDIVIVKKDMKSNNEITKNEMEPLMDKNVNNRMTQNAPLEEKMNRSSKSITPEPTKKKANSHTQLKSKSRPNSSRKAISESVHSGSRQLPKVSSHKNNTTNIFASDSIIPSENSTTNAMNSTFEEISIIQNLDLSNYIILRKTELENYITDKLLKKYIHEHTDVHSPPETSTISSPALKEQNDNFDNDLSRGQGHPSASYFADNLTIDFSKEKDSTNNKSVENNGDASYKIILIDTIGNDSNSYDTFDNSSTKLELLFDNITTKPTEESNSSYRPHAFINTLPSKEGSNSNYSVSFIDDLIRRRILNVLSTENLSVTSLRESILNILLTEEQIYNERTYKLALTDNPLNKNISETAQTVNLLSEDMIQLPLLNSQEIYEPQLSQNCSSEYDTHVDHLTFINPLQVICDNSSEITFEPFVIENSGGIILEPENIVLTSNDTLEVTLKSSNYSFIEKDPQQIVARALAENLREIISKPSSSHALVKDLVEIIRLLTIWNSRIEESNEVVYKSETNANNWNEFIPYPSKKVIFNSTIINKPIEDVQKFNPSAVEEIPFDSEVLNQSLSNNLISEKPSSDFTDIIFKNSSKNNDKFPEKYEFETTGIISEFVVNNDTILASLRTNSSEKNTEFSEHNNLVKNPTSVNSSNIFNGFSSNSSFVLYENFTAEPDLAKNTVTSQTTGDNSESIISEFLDNNGLFEVPIEVILEPIDYEMVLDDSIEGISELSGINELIDTPKSNSSNDNMIHDSKFGLNQISSNELSEIVNDYRNNDTSTHETESTSTEFPSIYSFNNVISSLNEESELFPISFDSTYMPLTDQTLHSIQNESESSPINILHEEHVLQSNNNSFENICTIIEDRENQCYSISEPDDFYSTSNLTDLVTGKLLLTSVEKPFDYSPDHFLSNNLLTDLIMSYVSNSTTESQVKVALPNVSDVDNLLVGDEMPDFSDYTSSPEEDPPLSDVNTILLNNESYCEHIAEAVLTDKLPTNNKSSAIPDFDSLEECSEINSINQPNELTLGLVLNTLAPEFSNFDDTSSGQNISDESFNVTACNEYEDTCSTTLDGSDKVSMSIDYITDLEKGGIDIMSDILNNTDMQIHPDINDTFYEFDAFTELSLIPNDIGLLNESSEVTVTESTESKTGMFNETGNEIVTHNSDNDINKLDLSCYAKLLNTSETDYDSDTEANHFTTDFNSSLEKESSCHNTPNKTLIDELSDDPILEESFDENILIDQYTTAAQDKSDSDQTTSSPIQTQIAQFYLFLDRLRT